MKQFAALAGSVLLSLHPLCAQTRTAPLERTVPPEITPAPSAQPSGAPVKRATPANAATPVPSPATSDSPSPAKQADSTPPPSPRSIADSLSDADVQEMIGILRSSYFNPGALSEAE